MSKCKWYAGCKECHIEGDLSKPCPLAEDREHLMEEEYRRDNKKRD
jgi:hypothetical protein